MKTRIARFQAPVIGVLALLLALALPLAGCSKKDDSGGTKPSTSTGTLSGKVSQSGSSLAVAGASVTSSAGGSTTTDGTGHFSLSIPANQNVQVNVTKAGYTLNQLLVNLTANQSSAVTVGLLPAGATQSVTVASGGTVTDPSSNATIALPANFVTATGPVTVTITGLDPTSDQIEALPGGLEAVDGNGATKYLKPVSFAEYTVKDAAGNTLQFNSAASSGADIELPIPASLVGQPGYANGDPIECYVYDPADGKWKTPVPGVIGPSSVNGDPAIKATIFHLSWYGGAPASDDIACVSGVVRDGSAHPVAGVHVEAYPGGSTTTNAQGEYQVQAAANSSVHVVASKAGSGTTFLVGNATVETGGTGAACATADFVLAETQGSYTVYAQIGDDGGDGYLYVELMVGATKESDGTPVAGARVKLTDGTSTWTIPEYQTGMYLANIASGLTPPFVLTPGKNYTLTLDYDANNVVDASGQARLVGLPVITNPVASANEPASFTATWTDNASSVSGYDATYLLLNYQISGEYSRTFITTNRSYAIGNNVTDPLTQLTNPPLLAGNYQFSVIAGSGPFFQNFGTSLSFTPNVTGPATTGYFYSFTTSEPVMYSSGLPTKAGGPSASAAPFVRKRTGFEPPIEQSKVRAAVARAQAPAAGRSASGSGN